MKSVSIHNLDRWLRCARQWLDGQDNTRPTTDPDAYNLTAAEDVRIGSRPSSDDRFFMGEIDELSIYDRVLSQEEIAWLAGRREPIHKPF